MVLNVWRLKNGPGARNAMATILEFSFCNGNKISDNSEQCKTVQRSANNCAEIIIFPGIRIERISSERLEKKQNRDKLGKIECQL